MLAHAEVFALRLAFGLLGRAGDVDGDLQLDLRMQVNWHRVQAEGLDRVLDRDVAALHPVSGGGQRFGDVARRHRTIELPRLAGLTNDDDPHPVELARNLIRAALELMIARFEIGAAALEFLLVGLGRAQGLATRQQEVAGVAVLHAHRIADMSEFADALEQNDVHGLSPFCVQPGWGSNERRARAQLEESVDDAEARQNRKGVLGPEHAAGVERDEHQGPHLQAARQRMRDCQALQRQGGSEPAGDDGEILCGRSGQGVGPAKAEEEHDSHRPGQRERGRHVGPRPSKVARQLGRAGRAVKVDAQHQERRGGDGRRAEPHQRVGEVAGSEVARRAVKGLGGEGGDRLSNVARAFAVAAVENDDGRQHPGAGEHSEQRRQRDNGADRRVDRGLGLPPAEISGERGDGERGHRPRGSGDGGGEDQCGQRLRENGEHGYRDRSGDRARVEFPAERRDHDRQRREIRERHRQNARLSADDKQERRGASRSDRDDKSMQHNGRCPALACG